MKHDAYLQAITDYFYGEAPLSEAVASHMAGCPMCSAHFEALKALAEAMPHMDHDSAAKAFPIDEALIASAFEAAEQRLKKRQERVQLMIFMCFAVCVIGGMTALIVLGKELQLLYAQGLLAGIALACLPFVVRQKIKQGY